MPRKSTATKRQRAAALQVSEPAPRLNGAAAPLAISHSGHGIAELAQELADVQRLCSRLADAEGPAERARDAMTDNSPEYEACSKALSDFGDIGRRAFGMVDGLERIILAMEPQTPNETLSLALILASELDVFLCDHTNDADCVVHAERRRLEHALQAVIRGLVHGAGATSPLMDAYSTKENMRPWAEARADATREAGPYLVDYDPVAGCLKKTRAAS
jgi:hypothetical protein